ncbi:hypothetical protein ACH5RR_010337 [Cinchona calisaya]|uniref:RPA-interacting protein N-terminal domain-containing protein n=1 Tax=Cinchona calisaya TaxID=153742 RepID=A0ABD3AIN6_9GENT
MGGEKEDKKPPHNRPSLKAHISFNNYPRWKDKLRENCFKRVRKDRNRLLWKLRLSDLKDQSVHHRSAFRDIFSDELKSIKDFSPDPNVVPDAAVDDAIWQYDGLHTAYQGDCEEILLEMQRIFYEDLRMDEPRKESEILIRNWDVEEDEYLSRVVYEHMQLNTEQVNLELLCTRLAEAHAEHLDRGSRLRPEFCTESRPCTSSVKLAVRLTL